MSRVIHCLGRRAVTLLSRPYSALPTVATNHRDHLCCNTAGRNIYTANAIGIDRLDNLRSHAVQTFRGDARERYVERLRNYLQSDNCKSIFKDDLVNMLAIAESESDLDLIDGILTAAEGEQRIFFQGWGTTVVRLYYKMGDYKRALNNIKDHERFGEFFNLRSCYKIVMAMLYDQGEYEKIVDLYLYAEERLKLTRGAIEYRERTGGDLQPSKDLVILLFAALAKMGTPEALEQAKALFARIHFGKRNFMTLRPISFVAYLAVQNGDANYALNLISSTPTKNYVSLRECKICALLHLERYDDVLIHMREYSTDIRDNPHLLLKSTFEKIRSAQEKIKDVAIRQEMDDILTEIKTGGHLSEQTLEEFVFRPIVNEPRKIIPYQNQFETYRPDRRAPRDGERDRAPFRRNHYNEDRYQADDDEEEFDRPRRGERGVGRGRGRGQGGDRKFAYQNVNFDA